MSSSVGLRYTNGIAIAKNAILTVDYVGFRPRRVVLRNITNNVMLEWVDTLADAAGFKTVADGTRTSVSADGITPIATGFTVGALADINDTTTELLHFEAWGN